MSTAPIERKRPEPYDLTVTEIRWESPDTATILLGDGERRFDYRAGQYVTIAAQQFLQLSRLIAYLEHVKGRKEPIRQYSLCTAPHEAGIGITVKEEEFIPEKTRYPPLLSPLLVRGLPVGSKIRVLGFSGPYVLPEDVDALTDHVVHIVAGSGAVPNFAIVKDALHRRKKVRHTFVCSNKTAADILFREELQRLQAAHPDKLRVVHTLTRETPPDEHFRAGRVSMELLRELIPDHETCLVYACGPAITSWDRRAAFEAGTSPTPRFIETVLGHLHEMGIPDKRIRRETYG